MSILVKRAASYSPASGASELDSWLSRAIAPASFTGKRITEASALDYSPIFACVRIISETLAMLPLRVYEENKSGSRAPAREHPVNWLTQREANPHMTSFTFRETLQGHVCTWGNAYAEIQRRVSGEIVSFWPLLPDKTKPKVEKGKLHYETTIEGKAFRVPREDILHVPGLGFDGYLGYSVIRAARNAIALGQAAEEFGSRWFGQGSQGGILLKHPGKLGKEGRENLRDYMEEEAAGLDNSHRVRVLSEGITYERIGIPPEDAQFLETRNFQVAEVARYFRMQLSKLQSLERAIQNNIETQQQEFVIDTMLPWATRWEQELNRKLFSRSELGRFYVKFNFNALLRGDMKSRAEFYHKATGGPWMAVNEVRALEEESPIEGGDELRTPVNMTSMSNLGKEETIREAA